MYGLGVLKGLAVTVKEAFSRPFTVQYPEERLPLFPRFRGYEFTWYIDRCTVCATCAKACPDGVIEIISEPRPDGSYEPVRFNIDTGRCMFCALCVEACPYDAIRMGTSFERANYSRDALIITKEELIAREKLPSTYWRTFLEREDAPEITLRW